MTLAEMLTRYAAKGKTVPAEVVLKMRGMFAPQSDLNLFTLRVRSILESLVKGTTIRVQQGAVRVLTDDEAASYLPRFFESGKKRMRRAKRKADAVDSMALSQEVFDEFQRNKQQMSVQVLLLSSKKKIDPEKLLDS